VAIRRRTKKVLAGGLEGKRTEKNQMNQALYINSLRHRRC
jgi:hypothetical protein